MAVQPGPLAGVYSVSPPVVTGESRRTWMALHKSTAAVGNDRLKWASSFLRWIGNNEILVVRLRKQRLPAEVILAAPSGADSLACFPADPP